MEHPCLGGGDLGPAVGGAVTVEGHREASFLLGLPLGVLETLLVQRAADLGGDHGQDVRTQRGQLDGVVGLREPDQGLLGLDQEVVVEARGGGPATR